MHAEIREGTSKSFFIILPFFSLLSLFYISSTLGRAEVNRWDNLEDGKKTLPIFNFSAKTGRYEAVTVLDTTRTNEHGSFEKHKDSSDCFEAGGVQNFDWNIVEGMFMKYPDRIQVQQILSVSFYSRARNYECPKVACEHILFSQYSYGHFLAGTNHLSSLAYLIHRVCELFQKCIPRDKIFVSLHVAEDSPRNTIQTCQLFLKSLNLHYDLTNLSFSATTKMLHYLDVMKTRNITSSSAFIYHSDMDEMIDTDQLIPYYDDLLKGHCDAVLGEWRDRIATDGSTPFIAINNVPINDQYPLRCQVSRKFLHESEVQKVILYRANIRVTPGQHHVWCGGNTDGVGSYVFQKSCKNDLNVYWSEKSIPKDQMMGYLPQLNVKPKICKSKLVQHYPLIDHYKFTGGVSAYLLKRANQYKAKKLAWWQKNEILASIFDDVENDSKTIDVRWSESKCFRTGKDILLNVSHLIRGRKFKSRHRGSQDGVSLTNGTKFLSDIRSKLIHIFSAEDAIRKIRGNIYKGYQSKKILIAHQAPRYPLLCVCILTSADIQATVALLLKNVKHTVDTCHWAIVVVQGTYRKLKLIELQIARIDGVNLVFSKMFDGQQESHCKIVTKYRIYPLLLPIINAYQWIWILDDNAVDISGFDISYNLKLLNYGTDSSNSYPHNVLIAYPIHRGRAGGEDVLNEKFWRSNGPVGVKLLYSTLHEQVLPIYDGNFLSWYVRYVVQPLSQVSQLLCNNSGIDRVSCLAAHDYGINVLNYTTENGHVPGLCGILVSDSSCVDHMVGFRDTNKVGSDENKMDIEVNYQLGKESLHFMKKLFPWWHKMKVPSMDLGRSTINPPLCDFLVASHFHLDTRGNESMGQELAHTP